MQHLGLAQSNLGSLQNRLDLNIEAISQLTMQFKTAHSGIMDADFARESSGLAKQQILSQASVAMLAQANQSRGTLMSLIQ